jgi:NADH:ubiquinone oxidoreductase subunit F (NADH-binding)
MEDRRAQPRNRPPELASNGFRDKPTAVNNVETLAWAPFIVLNGGAKYAEGGLSVAQAFLPVAPGTGKDACATEAAPAFSLRGRRLLSVSGDVNRPGVFEVPIGISFGELIDDPQYCGGIINGKALKAIAPSGPSSGLMPARIPVAIPTADHYDKWLADAVSRLRTSEEKAVIAGFAARHLPPGATSLDIRSLPLDLSFFRNVNGLLKLPAEAMLGAGITIFADGADILDLAVNFTRFFRNESCGKCVPCRIGSQKLYQIGFDLLAKRKAGMLTRQELLGESKDDPGSVKADVKLLGEVLQPTSICGLGYVAPIPLGSALAYFGPEIAEPHGA